MGELRIPGSAISGIPGESTNRLSRNKDRYAGGPAQRRHDIALNGNRKARGRGYLGVSSVPHPELRRACSTIRVRLIESSKLAGWGAPRDSHEACRRRDPQHSPPTETDRDGVVPGHRKWRRHGTRAGVSWSFLRPPPRASTGLLYYWRAVDRIVEASGMGHPEWHPSTRRRPLAHAESARSKRRHGCRDGR
jgi:hypothetical protein